MGGIYKSPKWRQHTPDNCDAMIDDLLKFCEELIVFVPQVANMAMVKIFHIVHLQK